MKKEVPPKRQLEDDYADHFEFLHQSFIDEERDATVREKAGKLIENVNDTRTLERLNTGVAADVTYLRSSPRIRCRFQVPNDSWSEDDQSVQDRFEIFASNQVLVFGTCNNPSTVGLSNLVDTVPDDTFGYKGVVSEIDGDRLTIVFDSVGNLPKLEFDDIISDISNASNLHIGVLLNPVPFNRKEEALATLSDDERKWGILLGETTLKFDSDILADSWPHDGALYENEAQKQGIEKALSAKDIAILHGPPGTGKTRVITELVRRLVDAEKRVLVACETNTAVRNLLIGSGPDPIDKSSLHHAELEDGFSIYRTNKESDSVHSFVRNRYGNGSAMSAHVVASTLSSAAPLFPDLDFDVAIIDEATQATKGSTAVAMILADSTILVGDHRQLPPFRQSPSRDLSGILSQGGVPKTYNLPETDQREKSTFEHIYGERGVYGEEIGVQFTTQYRMHEEIAEFPSAKFYDGTLETACEPEPIEDFSRVSLVDIDGEVEEKHNSKYNQAEAAAVERWIEMFLKAGVDPSEIGVAAAYREQADYLQMQMRMGPTRRGSDILISTFDGFQGSERDVMILSFVRSNEENIGFLSGSNGAKRLNVALTRAKRACVLVGNWDTLRNCTDTDLYKDLYDHAKN